MTENSILCSPVIQIAALKDLFWDWEDNRIIDGNGIWYIGSSIPLSEACIENLHRMGQSSWWLGNFRFVTFILSKTSPVV